MIPIIISASLKNHLREYSQINEPEVIKSFLLLKIPNQFTSLFNNMLQQLLHCSFYDIVQKNNITDLCSLIEVLLIVKDKGVKIFNKVILDFIDYSIEYLSIKDAKRISLSMLSQIHGLGHLENLDDADKYRLHKILNISLKKIEKTDENSKLRGNLHCLLTKILSFAHPSGLQAVQTIKKDICNLLTQQQFIQYFSQSKITYEYYLNYFKLHEKIQKSPEDDEQMKQAVAKLLQKKCEKRELNVLEKYFICQVQDLQNIVAKILKWFHDHNKSLIPYSFESNSTNYYPTPSHLLKFSDREQFQLSLLIQVLIYVSDLHLMFQKLVDCMDNRKMGILIQYLIKINQNILSNISNLFGEEHQKLILLSMKNLQVSEKVWIKLKQGKKNIFKTFAPCSIKKFQEVKQASKSVSPSTSNSMASSFRKYESMIIDQSIASSNSSFVSQASKERKYNQLGISVSKMNDFLNNDCQISIKKKPTSTSFNYYFSQARNCFESYDWKNKNQTYFESQRDYNCLQWRALRNLSRERLSAIQTISSEREKSQILKPHLMSFMGYAQSANLFPDNLIKIDDSTSLLSQNER